VDILRESREIPEHIVTTLAIYWMQYRELSWSETFIIFQAFVILNGSIRNTPTYKWNRSVWPNKTLDQIF